MNYLAHKVEDAATYEIDFKPNAPLNCISYYQLRAPGHVEKKMIHKKQQNYKHII